MLLKSAINNYQEFLTAVEALKKSSERALEAF